MQVVRAVGREGNPVRSFGDWGFVLFVGRAAAKRVAVRRDHSS